MLAHQELFCSAMWSKLDYFINPPPPSSSSSSSSPTRKKKIPPPPSDLSLASLPLYLSSFLETQNVSTLLNIHNHKLPPESLKFVDVKSPPTVSRPRLERREFFSPRDAETCRQDVDVCGCYRSPLPNLAVWLKDCAMFAGEDRDWAMCHVGEKYQHLSLCSEGFGSLKETLVRLII